MRWLAAVLLLALCAAPATDLRAQPAEVVFPAQVQQGALVYGRVPANAVVSHAGRTLRVTPYGTVVFGVPRDQQEPVQVQVQVGTASSIHEVAVLPRDWPIERVDGVPPKTVKPPPEIARRIASEQQRVSAARRRDDARTQFAEAFSWPVRGRISGRFGNQRVYNGTPGSAHSGMDIAAPEGTPVLAPAGGVVSFADADLYLTGGTIVIDHGHGVSSNFLHLSRLDVTVGETVSPGQTIGAVGATGRATGPHLHWGMNWFDVRVDPLLVLERSR